MENCRIPLIVGVTGHIALRPSDLPALRAAVKTELIHLKERCLHTQIAMLTSLAAGGDLLCADAFRQAGIYVSPHSHVLMALWDGSPPDAKSCGTSAAVDITLRGNYEPQSGSSVHKGTAEAIIHILASRDAADRRTAGSGG